MCVEMINYNKSNRKNGNKIKLLLIKINISLLKKSALTLYLKRKMYENPYSKP